MSARRTFSLSAMLAAALRYARCAICGAGPLSAIGVEWDHIDPWAMSRDSSADNCQPLCPACHAIKTNGTAATTAGSDKQRIAKVKRLRGETGQGRRKAKIASRPFPKDHRPIRGKSERKPT